MTTPPPPGFDVDLLQTASAGWTATGAPTYTVTNLLITSPSWTAKTSTPLVT